MIRPILRHCAAALALAAFLFGSAATALGAHRCPHHGAAGPHAAAERTGGHDAHHHGAADDGQQSCRCLGTCHGAAAVAAPGGGALARAVPAPADPSPVSAATVRARTHTPYLLPFANAPPRG